MMVCPCQGRGALYCRRITHSLPTSCASGSSVPSARSPLDVRHRFAVFAQRARCIAIEGER